MRTVRALLALLGPKDQSPTQHANSPTLASINGFKRNGGFKPLRVLALRVGTIHGFPLQT